MCQPFLCYSVLESEDVAAVDVKHGTAVEGMTEARVEVDPCITGDPRLGESLKPVAALKASDTCHQGVLVGQPPAEEARVTYRDVVVGRGGDSSSCSRAKSRSAHF